MLLVPQVDWIISAIFIQTFSDWVCGKDWLTSFSLANLENGDFEKIVQLVDALKNVHGTFAIYKGQDEQDVLNGVNEEKNLGRCVDIDPKSWFTLIITKQWSLIWIKCQFTPLNSFLKNVVKCTQQYRNGCKSVEKYCITLDSLKLKVMKLFHQLINPDEEKRQQKPLWC